MSWNPWNLSDFKCFLVFTICHFSEVPDGIRVTSDVPCPFLSHLAFRRCLERTFNAEPMPVIRLEPSIHCQVMEQGLSLASGFEHPASTSRLAFLQRSASARFCLRLS